MADRADKSVDKVAEQKSVIVESVRNGASFQAAAKAAGVTYMTLWTWRQKDIDFDQQILNAQFDRDGAHAMTVADLSETALIKAMKVLHDALDGEKRVPHATLTAAIFTIKAKLRWTETQRMEIQPVTSEDRASDSEIVELCLHDARAREAAAALLDALAARQALAGGTSDSRE